MLAATTSTLHPRLPAVSPRLRPHGGGGPTAPARLSSRGVANNDVNSRLQRMRSGVPSSSRRTVKTRASSTPPSSSSWASSPLSIFCPLLKLVSGGDAAAPRNRVLEVATSGVASITRLPFGVTVDEEVLSRPATALPQETIVLYEFEACPFCRRVREALTQLDLTVEVRPCPKDSAVHRAEVEALGGKLAFPFLVDPNTDTKMNESADIVKYLYDTYGNGAPFPENIISSTILTGWMPTLLRAGRGMSRYVVGLCIQVASKSS